MTLQSRFVLLDRTTHVEIRSTVYLGGFAEGFVGSLVESFAGGFAESVLGLLGFRDERVLDEVREKFLSCTDSGQLTAWLHRVLTADSIGDVLGASNDSPPGPPSQE